MSLLAEIKRRKVFQVAAVYAIVAGLAAQVVDVVNEPLGLPAWFDTSIIVLFAAGYSDIFLRFRALASDRPIAMQSNYPEKSCITAKAFAGVSGSK